MSWDGRYSTSKEGQQSLEKDIEDAMGGKFTWEDPETGGKCQVTDHSWNMYAPSSTDPKGYAHVGHNYDTGETYTHDGKK